MNSLKGIAMAARHAPSPPVLAVLMGLAGAAVAAVLGLLTFGAQATVHPDHVPLAVAAPADGPLRGVAGQIASQGGDAVSWQVTSPEQATNLLDDKKIYGYLDLTSAPATPKIVVSGAINPQGTQFAQQILTEVVHKLAATTSGAPAVQTIMIHPASLAGRTAPLAASALLWICGLVATLGFGAITSRRKIRAGIGARSLVALTASVAGVGVICGFYRLWDNTLPLTWSVLGFLLLTAFAFTAVQGALLRLFHLRAAVVLGPLYLIAPAVAGQVPELLNPAYRAALWSWTPFRFSTEGLRSLLMGTPSAPDVRLGIIVLASMAAAGLAVLIFMASRSSVFEKAQPNGADGVVDVGVDEADGLPGAEGEVPVQDRNGGVRRYQRR
jgi:hypothetical protein